VKKKLSEVVAREAVVPAGTSQLLIWDIEITRYGLRAYPSGRKVHVFRYRLPGDRTDRTLMLGTFPAVSVDDARKAARIAAGKVAKGLDPAADRREAKRRAEAILSHLLAPEGPYARHLEERQLVNAKTILSTLRRGSASFANQDVGMLDRADWVGCMDAITAADKQDTGFRKAAKQFLDWTTARKLTLFNPLAGLRKPATTRAQRLATGAKRARALSDAQIRALWAVTAPSRADAFGTVARVALLTGMRRGECADLTTAMLKPDRISLPPHVTKSGRGHDIVITPLLRHVLDQQPAIPNAFDLLFPTRRTRTRIRAWSPSLKRLRKASGISDLRMHDLRKTCRTIMSKCGISDDVAGLAIGHGRKGLDAIYNEDPAWAERCDAFHAVAAYIAALLATEAAEPASLAAAA
jgi:integrase